MSLPASPARGELTRDVSVIVCTHTAHRWDALEAGLRSLAAQTVRPLEVLVVVDHDDALLARAHAQLPGILPGVRVLASGGRRGLSGSRNTGVAASRGAIVAFLDDDAVAGPEWIERLVAPYADEAVMATGARCVPAWHDGRPWWFPREFDWVVGCSYLGLPEEQADIRNPIGAGMSMRRTALDRAGAFREDIGRVGNTPLGCEETELAIRMRQRIPGARVVHVPSAVVAHAVPSERGRPSYFVRRCFAEGVSKAQVARAVGRGDALDSERAYAGRVLPAGILAGLRRAARGDGAALGPAGMILAGLAATAAGFILGVLRGSCGVAPR